jgi:hypothetical protein
MPILVIGTGAACVAASRFPQALSRAGAVVSLLVPSNAHARHTRHVARVGVVPPDASPERWVEALFALVDIAAPRAIVAADRGALDLVGGLAHAPPAALRPERAAALASRLAESIGPPGLVAASLDPGRREALMAACGVRTIRPRLAEARADASGAGRPAVGDAAGATYTHHVAALGGKVLACATAEHVVVDSADGRPSVLRFCAHDGIARAAERAVAAMEASGCLSLDFVDDGGEPQLAGVDRHVVPTMHVSQWLGVDLAGAWLAALDGRKRPGATTLPEGTSRYSVAFPQEWQRDPASRWLREQRVDVPWDDPDVLDVILQDAVASIHGR